MANWAETTYAIIGEKEDLDKIENVISYMKETKKDEKEARGLVPDADIMWEGNIIKLLGGDPYKKKEWYMRGFITDYSREDEKTLKIWADEAWETTDFRLALGELLPVKIYFMTEETEMDVYQTNDAEGKYFPGRYLFIHSNGDYDYLYSEEDVETAEEDDPDGKLMEVDVIDDSEF